MRITGWRGRYGNVDQPAITARQLAALADARKIMTQLKDLIGLADTLLASPNAERGFIGQGTVHSIGQLLPALQGALYDATNASQDGRFEVRELQAPQLTPPADHVVLDDAGKRGLRNKYTEQMFDLDQILTYVPVGTAVSIAIRIWEPLCEDGVNTVAAIGEFVAAVAAPDFRHVSRRSLGERGPMQLCAYAHDTTSPTGCKLVAAVRETPYTQSLVPGTICAGGRMGNA